MERMKDMVDFSGLGFVPGDFLLPVEAVEKEKWACVACDQYTSQPEYWREVEEIVGEAPSCLKLVLPECDLPQTAQRVPRIHEEMRRYVREGVLTRQVEGGFVLVERTTESGVRVGLVGTVDLEDYDFTGKKCLIRPTEQTITARLPARLEIRRGAPLELAHILLLLDDPKRTVLEPLYARRNDLPALYDFPLMQGGGHLRGWAVTQEGELAAIRDALTALRDSLGADPLLFAVGDGNHSLATAKARWEEIKPTLSLEEQAHHPARFAMVEVENIHDEALKFEPIHRVLTGLDASAVEGSGAEPQYKGDGLVDDWVSDAVIYLRTKDPKTFAGRNNEEADAGLQDKAPQTFTMICEGEEQTFTIKIPDGPIPVATLQRWLDSYLARHPEVEIDYIHGDDVLRRLASRQGAAGFLLPPLDKHAFFAAIDELGILPRKTFSMGHAHEKRFYMECRAIE